MGAEILLFVGRRQEAGSAKGGKQKIAAYSAVPANFLRVEMHGEILQEFAQNKNPDQQAGKFIFTLFMEIILLQ